jgi:hypothetical protein
VRLTKLLPICPHGCRHRAGDKGPAGTCRDWCGSCNPDTPKVVPLETFG